MVVSVEPAPHVRQHKEKQMSIVALIVGIYNFVFVFLLPKLNDDWPYIYSHWLNYGENSQFWSTFVYFVLWFVALKHLSKHLHHFDHTCVNKAVIGLMSILMVGETIVLLDYWFEGYST